MRLSEAFLAGLGGKGSRLGRSAGEVERLFAQLDGAGAAFARSVGERLSKEADALEALGGLHLADLLLAHRAAAGEREALEQLDRQIVVEARAVARSTSPLAADELAQLLRQKLLVGE